MSRQYISSFDSGVVTLTMPHPDEMSDDEIKDLRAWLAIIDRQLLRALQEGGQDGQFRERQRLRADC